MSTGDRVVLAPDGQRLRVLHAPYGEETGFRDLWIYTWQVGRDQYAGPQGGDCVVPWTARPSDDDVIADYVALRGLAVSQ